MAEIKTLPPPPPVRRFDEFGRPTKAQIEYDLRLNEFVKNAADTGLANKVNSLITQVNTIETENHSQTTEITAIKAKVGDNTAEITAERTARVAGDTAIATDVTTLTARVGASEGTITSERTLRIDGDTALGTRIDNLVVSSGNNAAVIIDSEAQARIAADNALGSRVDTVLATTNANTAAITTEQIARADADTALGLRVDTVSAVAGQQRVFLQTNQPAALGRIVGDLWINPNDSKKAKYWDGTNWVDATYDVLPTVSAAISVETQARIDADKLKADASQVTTLQTTVNNNTSSINSLISSTNGLSAQWAIQATINGTTGGLSFTGVKRADGVGANYNLEINAGVTINGALLVNGSIAANKLSANNLSAISADLGNVTTGRMSSPDGKFVIDLTNRTLTISD